ncbi:MAG: hypothetical protein M0011_00235 [Elusimicrobia bacterium]|nr:hypothetical protein [Elusimicrobiota bacterium]
MPASDWTIFWTSASFVVLSGSLIGRVSGELGERLGLGRAWAGAVLLSFATTLPELVATATVTIEGAYGLALGGIIGSVVFNLFILAAMDLADPEPLYAGGKLSRDHLATGLLGTALLAVVMAGLALGLARNTGLAASSPGALLFAPAGAIALYFTGQAVLFRMAKRPREKEPAPPAVFSSLGNGALAGAYAVTAGVILVSASALGSSVNRLAEHYGLSATFAGAVMLGVVTSLPEITNAFACARRKEYDLAVGNLLGANALVLAVLAAASLAAGNRIFAAVSPSDAVSALIMAGIAVVMQAIALGALAAESGHGFRRLRAASLLLAALYAASLYLSSLFGR